MRRGEGARRVVSEGPEHQTEPPPAPPPSAPPPPRPGKAQADAAPDRGRGLSNRDRLSRAFEHLAAGLAPVIRQRMQGAYGAAWHRRLNGGHMDDLSVLLRLVIDDARLFDGRLRSLARRVRDGRNKYAHRFGKASLGPSFTDATLENTARLLEEVGAYTEARKVWALRGNWFARFLNPRYWLGRSRPDRQRPPRPLRRRRSIGRLPIGCAAVLGIWLLAGFALMSFARDHEDGYLGDDPARARYDKAKTGRLLGTYRRVDLSDGYHVDFLHDPKRPQPDAYQGDLVYSAGTLVAPGRRMAVLGPREKGGYAGCRANTRYTEEVTSAKVISKGRRLCVTTDLGAIGMVTIRGRHTGPSPYVTFDLSVWKGTKPSA